MVSQANSEGDDASPEVEVEVVVAQCKKLQKILSERDEEIAQLRQRISELLSQRETSAKLMSANSTSASGESASLKAVETLVNELQSPVIHTLNCLEATTSGRNSEGTSHGVNQQIQQKKTRTKKKKAKRQRLTSEHKTAYTALKWHCQRERQELSVTE